MPPAVGVCESLPSSVLPGRGEPLQVDLVADAVARPAEWYAPTFAATDWRYRWSLWFSGPNWAMLWST